MATLPKMANETRKLSFAKVAAASASKDSVSVTTMARPHISANARDRRERNQGNSGVGITAVPDVTSVAAQVSGALVNSSAMQRHTKPEQSVEPETEGESKGLKLGAKPPNLTINGSSAVGSSRTANSQTPSDDNSQRADSSSDLGTKPPSLDGKSITSGTTFALDEKESLRPDDSASVKAAAEDDDSFSVRGSYIAGSRMGSDIAARFQRIQIGDMPLRPLATAQLVPGQGPGIATPQSGGSEKQPATESKMPLVGSTAPADLTVAGFLSKNPDEKLLEAMQSPKDRLFLLRLEQQVIEFVQDSKEPFMDLPPSNSFCRMLTHKLADYYHMTHSFEAVAGAVRIFRTPFCRIPPSLSSIATNPSTSSSPAPAVLPRKIMRRGEDGEFAPVSASPSKPTSEAGSDSKERNAVPKEKLTREEREEAYNKARQRIFGSVESTENSTPDVDTNGVSRASSVSAKDRSNVGKRKVNKQRRDDSEGFESRSQYVAWAGGPQMTWATASPHYFPVSGGASFNGQYQHSYPQGQPQATFVPNQGFPQMAPSNTYGVQYGGMATYPGPPAPQAVPPQPQRFQPPNPPIPLPFAAPIANGHPQALNGMPQPNLPQPNMPQPNMPQPNLSQPGWPQQPFNQNSFPPNRASPGPAGIPYAYGQLPANANPHDPKSQHPIPGSYTRQPFNPKSQTFVPTNGIGPMQPPQNPYGSSSPHHGSPQFHSPHPNYGFQQPLPQPVYGPGPVAYGMARQGSNNSLTQYHPPQQPLGPHGPHGPQHLPPNASPHIPNKPIGPPQTFNHLPTYGNPATLPQKPT